MATIDYKKLLQDNTGNKGNVNEKKFIDAVRAEGGSLRDARRALAGETPSNSAQAAANIAALQRDWLDNPPIGFERTDQKFAYSTY